MSSWKSAVSGVIAATARFTCASPSTSRRIRMPRSAAGESAGRRNSATALGERAWRFDLREMRRVEVNHAGAGNARRQQVAVAVPRHRDVEIPQITSVGTRDSPRARPSCRDRGSLHSTPRIPPDSSPAAYGELWRRRATATPATLARIAAHRDVRDRRHPAAQTAVRRASMTRRPAGARCWPGRARSPFGRVFRQPHANHAAERQPAERHPIDAKRVEKRHEVARQLLDP